MMTWQVKIHALCYLYHQRFPVLSYRNRNTETTYRFKSRFGIGLGTDTVALWHTKKYTGKIKLSILSFGFIVLHGIFVSNPWFYKEELTIWLTKLDG